MQSLYKSYRSIFSDELLNLFYKEDVKTIENHFQSNISIFSELRIDSSCIYDHGVVGAVNIVNFFKRKFGWN